MTTRRTAVGITALAALALAACSNTSGSSDNAAPTGKTASTTKPAAAAKKVDCSDPNLSQADWTAHCDKQASSLHLQFGQTYTWPDGVKATVTQAKVFTNFNKEYGEHPSPGATDYQVMVKVTNGSHAPIDLNFLSVITEGATNGGEAMLALFDKAGPGLEGRLAPGVTVTKADPESLETKYGRKIVVTVQRTGGDNVTLMDSPEFTGSITN